MIDPLTNIPSDAFYTGGNAAAVGVADLPSPAQLITYANSRGVRCTDTIEIRFCPDSASEQFYDPIPGPFTSPSSNAVSPNLNGVNTVLAPTAIGFAFTNLAPTNGYILEAVKAFEYKLRPVSGLMASTGVGNNIPDPSYVSRAVRMLQRMYPDWQTRAMEMGAESLGTMMRNIVLGGSDYTAGVRGRNNLLVGF